MPPLLWEASDHNPRPDLPDHCPFPCPGRGSLPPPRVIQELSFKRWCPGMWLILVLGYVSMGPLLLAKGISCGEPCFSAFAHAGQFTWNALPSFPLRNIFFLSLPKGSPSLSSLHCPGIYTSLLPRAGNDESASEHSLSAPHVWTPGLAPRRDLEIIRGKRF